VSKELVKLISLARTNKKKRNIFFFLCDVYLDQKNNNGADKENEKESDGEIEGEEEWVVVLLIPSDVGYKYPKRNLALHRIRCREKEIAQHYKE
jgi:hypothetical protein